MAVKKEREPQDFYPTPIPVIQTFLNTYNKNNKISENAIILEPSAGNGNFISTMKDMGFTNKIDAIEIRREELDNLTKCADDVIIGDFLKIQDLQDKYDVIIGNPPFMYALEFVQKSLDIVKDDGKVIMLLRTAFLESKKRFEFLRKYPPNELYTLHERPKFVGDGTDRYAYSWFVWDKSTDKQIISVI